MGALGLAEVYLLWSLLQFVIWKKNYIKYEKWAGLLLIAGTVLYLVLVAVAERRRRGAENGGPAGSVKEFLRKAMSREQIFLIGFLVWYAVVCAVRTALDGKSYFSANDNRLFYTALSSLLFFPMAKIAAGIAAGISAGTVAGSTTGTAAGIVAGSTGGTAAGSTAESTAENKVKKTIDLMLCSAVAAYTPVCAWVLWNFYHGVFVNLPSGNVVKLYQGLSLMIGVHRNTTAAYSLILLSICVYMLVTIKSRIKYVFFIPAAVVHFFVIILSNSRTCYMVLLAMIIVPALVRGAGYLKRVKIKNKALVVAGAVAAAVLVVAALYFLRSGIIASNAETWREKLHNPDAMRVRKMVGLSGRINIWKASVKLMFSSPDRFFFGVTPTMLPSVLWEIGKFPVKQPNCHNVILQVGTCFGVPMMLLYIWFTASVALRGLRVMRDGGRLFRGAWVIPVIFFGILMTDMLEVLTCANAFFNQPVYFLLAGWIMAMDRALAAQKGQNSAI
ncbi:MAG: O-antigen ligase family protein [Lachnospiraceae bacterium]|nr:O-antigen ligase family protein [Lachnospiraceae bacterium]